MRQLLLILFLLLPVTKSFATTQPQQTFHGFVEDLWTDARARGVTRATFDRAFAGVQPDPRVLAVTRRQPEYGKPFGAYVADFVSASRLAGGMRAASQWKETLAAIEKQFGVDPYLVIAIWGMETAYGSYKPSWDVIRSLATLAHSGYRAEFFRNELLAALQILQEGHIARDRMLGSWAGAMGQSQFIPTSFVKLAIDFTGDGRRDIWSSVPDVLGSIANYFRANGWQPGKPWGFEVVVPRGFDYRRSRASFREWAALGVRRADGGALPANDDAILFFPSGARGPAFLVTENFAVIKRYNNSDAYAISAAHLADRLRGGAPFRGPWPTDDVQLSQQERMEMQRRFAALGYKVNNFAGQIDFDLRDAIRHVQARAGMLTDGHPTPAILDLLRAERRSN